MTTTTGTSNSCMGRSSGSGNSSSRVTLATGKYLSCKFQIFPRFALLRRRAQQVGRMISHDQRDLGGAKAVDLLAQSPELGVGPQQILCGDAPDHQHYLRSEQRDLPVKIWQAFHGLYGRRIAILRWTALQDVRDVDLFTLKADGPQHGVQELTGAADEGFTLAIFLGAGRLAHHQPFRLQISHPENGL